MLQADLTDESKGMLVSLADDFDNSIVYIDIDVDEFDKQLPTDSTWSIETYFRLKLFDVLPTDVDRILYLDGDMIVNKDITDLYYMTFDHDRHFIVTHDMTMVPDADGELFQKYSDRFKRLIRENKYFNAGMILMDYSWLRMKYWKGRVYL